MYYVKSKNVILEKKLKYFLAKGCYCLGDYLEGYLKMLCCEIIYFKSKNVIFKIFL